MRQYYYLASSLPTLFYDRPKPIAADALQQQCKMLLSARDYELLEAARTEPPESNDGYAGLQSRALRMYWCWETSLRNGLVKVRSRDLEVNGERFIRPGFDCDAIQPILAGVSNAYAESPLKVEDALNRARWSYLSELEAGNIFNIEYLIVYRLKLSILELKSKMNKKDGALVFNDCYSRIHAAQGR